MEVRVPCAICTVEYPVERAGIDWMPGTGVCTACYRAGVGLPARVWCFGDPTQYNSENPECADTCPDRSICKLVATGRLDLEALAKR